MKESSTPVLSGLAVLLTGLLAFIVVTHSPGEAATVTTETPVAEAASPSAFTNLDPAVEHALLDSGQAWILQEADLADIPASVVHVLDAYQMPLMIAVEGEG